jgi:ABC-type sugar transport system substrate-binding protein
MHPRRLSVPSRRLHRLLWLVLALSPLALTAKPREVWETYKIAVIAGNGEAPAAKAIEAGAESAAPALEDEYNLAITVDNLSPLNNTAQSRREAIHRVFLDGYSAVLLNIDSSSEVAEEIDFLNNHGIPVVTVGSDITSRRLAAILTDEEASGRLAAETFVKNLRFARDKIAVLAGRADDPVTQLRLAGAEAALEMVPDMEIDGPYYTAETFSGTFPKLTEVIEADHGRNLRGWLILGNWPLLGGRPLPWKPGEKVCVAMDGDPHVIPFVASGQVQAVLAEDNFAMGKLGLTLLIDKVHNKKDPEQAVYTVPPLVLTRENLAEFQRNWTQWLQ